jgi:hypothetical protein
MVVVCYFDGFPDDAVMVGLDVVYDLCIITNLMLQFVSAECSTSPDHRIRDTRLGNQKQTNSAQVRNIAPNSAEQKS